MGKIPEKVAMAEMHIKGLLATINHLEEQFRSLTKKSSVMDAKLEDQEGRSRRNNVRVVGVPEGMEGPSADLFVEDLVLNKLETTGAVPCSKTGDPAKYHTARILNYRDQNAMLQAARSFGDLKQDNAIIRFFLDFSLHVQHQQKNFEEVKKVLRAMELKYMMLFQPDCERSSNREITSSPDSPAYNLNRERGGRCLSHIED
ncbi:hypothetical protein NDU88_006356 [Pleurodeles waltl]|uniref:Uncharacterized protein n=1 Tax=Pleurodeles waltl TaxID=8319 RepID=A0AAV7MFI1_PLEWA|nr:hypothetical protein NDU88_006356 [Pleurodeles waltl]